MPAFFKVNENLDAQKQILHSWWHEIMSVAQLVTGKILTVKQLFFCMQYILNQFFEIFKHFSIFSTENIVPFLMENQIKYFFYTEHLQMFPIPYLISGRCLSKFS